jgi:hypothetical protein
MTTDAHSLHAVEAYVRSIRNRDKRTYAERKLRNLRNGWETPNAPCSIMARQAVDMRIANIRREA